MHRWIVTPLLVLLHWWDRVVFVHMESSPNVVSWGCQCLWFSGMSVMTDLFLSKIKNWLHISHVISEKKYAKSLGMLFSSVKMICHENSFGELTRCSETPRSEHFPGICPMSSESLLNGGHIHINDHIMLWPCPTSHRVLYSYPALTAGNLSPVMLSSPQYPSMYYGYTPVLL